MIDAGTSNSSDRSIDRSVIFLSNPLQNFGSAIALPKPATKLTIDHTPAKYVLEVI
ncbi:MAG: hypothetical protein VKJ24_16145 [Synechococcales bacterium]|nr:hypothetical protein [Synechococcales bacterium]